MLSKYRNDRPPSSLQNRRPHTPQVVHLDTCDVPEESGKWNLEAWEGDGESFPFDDGGQGRKGMSGGRLLKTAGKGSEGHGQKKEAASKHGRRAPALSVDDATWIASMLVWGTDGPFSPPAGGNIVWMGQRARERRIKLNVEAWIRQMSSEEFGGIMRGCGVIQAHIRRWYAMSHELDIAAMESQYEGYMMERGVEDLDGAIPLIASRPWTRDGMMGRTAKRVPPNTPMGLGLAPHAPGHEHVGHLDKDSSHDSIAQGPFNASTLRPPWDMASSICADEGMVCVASGNSFAIYDLAMSSNNSGSGSVKHSSSPPTGVSPNRRVYINGDDGAGSSSSTSIKLVMEVRRGELAAVSCIDCAVQWGFVRKQPLRAATPGVSRLTSQFGLIPGSYEQASRESLGTPVLSRFKPTQLSGTDVEGKSSLVATGDTAGRIVVLNVRNGAVVNELEGGLGSVLHVKMFDKGMSLVSIHEGGHLIMWDIADGFAFYKGQIPGGGWWGIQEIGGWLLVSSDAEVSITGWKVESLRNRGRKRVELEQQAPATCFTSDVVYDALMVATGGIDGTLRIWKSVHAGSQPSLLFGHKKPINCLASSGGRIVSGSCDCDAIVWEAKDLRCLQILSGHQSEITSVWCDSRQVITGSADGELRSWAPTTGTCVYRINQPSHDYLRHDPSRSISNIFYLTQHTTVLSLVCRDQGGAVTLWLPKKHQSQLSTSPPHKHKQQNQQSQMFGAKVKGAGVPRGGESKRRQAKMAGSTRTSEARSRFGASTCKRLNHASSSHRAGQLLLGNNSASHLAPISPPRDSSTSPVPRQQGYHQRQQHTRQSAASPMPAGLRSPVSGLTGTGARSHSSMSMSSSPVKWFGSRAARVTIVAPQPKGSPFDDGEMSKSSSREPSLPWHGKDAAAHGHGVAGERALEVEWLKNSRAMAGDGAALPERNQSLSPFTKSSRGGATTASPSRGDAAVCGLPRIGRGEGGASWDHQHRQTAHEIYGTQWGKGSWEDDDYH